jgi:hypothetical protein
VYTGGGFLFFFLASFMCAVGRGSAATISVNPGSILRPVPATGLGLHTSTYASQWGNPDLPAALNASGVQLLRYPGGSYADAYQWTDHFNSQGYQAANSDFANFARVLQQSSSAGMVTVNYGSSIGYNAPGSPQAAAAWVAYANASPNNRTVLGKDSTGRDWFTAGYWASLRTAAPLRVDDGYNYLRMGQKQPVGVKYWEVGNEIFGNGYYSTSLNWEMDLNSTASGAARVGNSALSPTIYGTRFVQFASLMKAVDPTIKVGAVLTGPNETGDVSDPARNWNRNVLTAAGSAIDFGVVHFYPSNTAANPSQLLNAPGTKFPNTMARLRSDVQTYTGRDPNSVEYHITEFGNFGDTPTNPQRLTYVATTYATAMAQGFSSAEYLEMSANGFLNDSTLAPGPAYFALQSVAPLLGKGGTLLTTSSSSSTLDAFACLRADGLYAITLINKNQSAAESCTVSLAGVTGTLSGQLVQGLSTGLTTTTVSGISPGSITASVPANAVYTFVLSGGNPVVVTSTASVPDPGGTGLGGLGTLSLLQMRRRKQGGGR